MPIASKSDQSSAVFLTSRRPIAFNVGLHSAIGIELDGEIDPKLITSKLFLVKVKQGHAIPGTILMVSKKKYLFKPDTDLALNSTYYLSFADRQLQQKNLKDYRYIVRTQSTAFIVYGAKPGYGGWSPNFKASGSTGVGGADNLCNTNQYRPDTSGNTIYKAMLSASGQRIACSDSNCNSEQSLNWVLKPNTTYNNIFPYYEPNDYPSEAIGTTTSGGVFSFPLSSQLAYGFSWTGLNQDWTANENTCNGWASSEASYNGQEGAPTHYTDSKSISSGSTPCVDTWLDSLLCAEQPPTSMAATENSEGQIPTDTKVEIEFGYDVDSATVNSGTVTMTLVSDIASVEVPGTVSGSGASYEFTPSNHLLSGATYKINLSAEIIDGVGNSVPASSYTFTTELNRSVLIDPSSGDRRQIELDSTFTEQYPSDTDESTIETKIYEQAWSTSSSAATASDLSTTVSCDSLGSDGWGDPIAISAGIYNPDNNTLIYTPQEPLDADSRIKISTTFRANGADFMSVFCTLLTTKATGDNAIYMIKPPEGRRLDVKVNTAIGLLVRGSGSIDENNVNDNTIQLSEKVDGSDIASVKYQHKKIGDKELTLKPDADLTAGATVTVAIKDLKLTDGSTVSNTVTFNTTVGNPIVVTPYPLDEMSLNGAIEVRYPSVSAIDKSSVNSSTFTATNADTGEQYVLDYIVRGAIIIARRASNALWPANARIHIEGSDIVPMASATPVPDLDINTTTVAQLVECRVIYEATNGGLGYAATEIIGLNGADAICNRDPSKPTSPEGAYYRAMLGANGGNEENKRWGDTDTEAGPSPQWVLLPSNEYCDVNGNLIGTTNSDAVFSTGQLSRPINEALTARSWSGLNTHWIVQRANNGAFTDCNGWTGLTNWGQPTGNGGSPGDHASTSVDEMLELGGISACTERRTFACVQQ